MEKKPYLLIDNRCIYNAVLSNAIVNELEDINPDAVCGLIKGIGDVFRASVIIVCGNGGFPKWLFWIIAVLRKPLVLYYVSPDGVVFKKWGRRAKWVVPSRTLPGYDYYPSPVLLGDLITGRQIDRIWRRERMLSKRGSIGVLGLTLAGDHKQKLLEALDMLIEDLDLNVVFIPIFSEKMGKDIFSHIKYSGNVKFIRSDKYSARELLGIISKMDIIITSDRRGAMCALAGNRPPLGVTVDDELDDVIGRITEEELIFDMDKLAVDELYSKIKICWVHRDSIVEQMGEWLNELKKQGKAGIKCLYRNYFA